MAKSHNQKAKILILEHLLAGTSRDQIVTMQEILDRLAEYDITAERKSIYDDLEALREFGLDIEFKRGRPGGYYLKNGNVPSVQEKPTADKAQKAVPAKASAGTENGFMSLCKSELQEADKPMKLVCRKSKEKEMRAFFGTMAEYKIKEDGEIQITVPQISGPQFFGWLTAMGKDVHILKPKKTAVAYRDYLKTLAKEYKGV